MRRCPLVVTVLLILGAAASARAADQGSGGYVGFVTHSMTADADLTVATDTLRNATTGALLSFTDKLIDPDISFDAEHQEAGFGIRFGYNRMFSDSFGVNFYGELGAVHSAFPIREDDAAAPSSKFTANAFVDDGLYFLIGAGVFGDLPVEVGSGPMSWTAGFSYSTSDNTTQLDCDTGGPLQRIESEIDHSTFMVEGTIGITLRETRLFLAVASVSSDITFTEVDTDMGAGPSGEVQTTRYEAEWSSGLLISIGAEVEMESATAFARLHLIGASGGSVGIAWRF